MVYVIIVYDIAVERQNEVREFLKKYLDHVQNSVFEGEIKPAKLYFIRKVLSKMIDKEKDSVIIYVLQGKNILEERIVIGVDKKTDFI